MKKRSILLTVSLLMTIGILSAGYLIPGYWQILPVLLVVVLFRWFTRELPGIGPPSSVLIIFVTLAAIGIVSNLSLFLMLAAGTAALVTWDLMLFDRWPFLKSEPESASLLERKHLQSLALAASIGLFLAWVSSYLNLHFPFIIVAVLSLLVIAGFVYGITKLRI